MSFTDLQTKQHKTFTSYVTFTSPQSTRKRKQNIIKTPDREKEKYHTVIYYNIKFRFVHSTLP